MSVELVMPSNHLILYHPLLLLPSIFPSIKVLSNEMTLYIRWPKYWSFCLRISTSNEYSGLISLRLTGFNFLQSKGFSRVFSNTTIQKHQFFSTQLSSQSNSPHVLPPQPSFRLVDHSGCSSPCHHSPLPDEGRQEDRAKGRAVPVF